MLQVPKSRTPSTVSDEEVYEEQSFVSEWEEIDDYMYTENYAKEYWANRQIQEALVLVYHVKFKI